VTVDARLPIFAIREATFVHVKGESALMAKVYRSSVDLPPPRKLGLMVANPPVGFGKSDIHTNVAWPVDILFSLDTIDVAGYLVRTFDGSFTLADAIDPVVRRFRLPNLSTRDLYDLCINLSASINSLHQSGYIVGNLSPDNVVVCGISTTLINCDYYQVEDADQKQTISCVTTDADFKAPELTSPDQDTKPRVADHDDFSLAIIIFGALMNGTGRPVGILHAGLQRKPVASVDALVNQSDFVESELLRMFERAFDDNNAGSRPTSQDWQKAISNAQRSLVCCDVDPLHWFPKENKQCPWCDPRVKFQVQKRELHLAQDQPARPISLNSEPEVIQTSKRSARIPKGFSYLVAAMMIALILAAGSLYSVRASIERKTERAERLRLQGDAITNDNREALTDLGQAEQLSSAAGASSSQFPFNIAGGRERQVVAAEVTKIATDQAALSQSITVENDLNSITSDVVGYSRMQLTDLQANAAKATVTLKCKNSRERAMRIVTADPYCALAWSNVIRADEIAADSQSEKSDQKLADQYLDSRALN